LGLTVAWGMVIMANLALDEAANVSPDNTKPTKPVFFRLKDSVLSARSPSVQSLFHHYWQLLWHCFSIQSPDIPVCRFR
jgi:hypothetical protein